MDAVGIYRNDATLTPQCDCLKSTQSSANTDASISALACVVASSVGIIKKKKYFLKKSRIRCVTGARSFNRYKSKKNLCPEYFE